MKNALDEKTQARKRSIMASSISGLAMIITGFSSHLASHWDPSAHPTWLTSHVLASIAFSIFIIWHIRLHRHDGPPQAQQCRRCRQEACEIWRESRPPAPDSRPGNEADKSSVNGGQPCAKD
jgi:hypothetical protein